MQIDFIGAAYTSRSKSIDCQECINLYPEIEQNNSKNVAALIGTPGLKPFYTPSVVGINRGLYKTSTNRLVQVVGNTVLEIGVSGTLVRTLGHLETVSGIVGMVDNGIELIIVDGKYGYIVNLNTNTTTRITEEGFPSNPSHVIFKDGYFIVNSLGTLKFYYSTSFYVPDALDGSHWNALNFFTAEGSPDNIVALSTLNNEIWCFGDQTVEVFYNTGDPDYLFSRVGSAFLNIGTVARYSVATNGNAIFWLGSDAQGDGIVWMSTSYQPQRVTTHAIEYLIKKLDYVSDAIGYTYQQDGHSFYVLNFPTSDKTIVYDMTTGLWHTRTSYDNVTNTENRHRASVHAFFNGKNIVGDYKSGKLFELDFDTYTDDGNYIIRTRSAPHIHNDMKRVYYKSFEVDMEKGVGLTSGLGQDPYATLQWSNDGGYNWSTEIQASIGKKGERLSSVKWRRLGAARDRVFRFRYSFPTKCILINAHIEVDIE